MTTEQLRTYINSNRKFFKVYNIGKAAGLSKNVMTQFLNGSKLTKEAINKIKFTIETFQKPQ